MKNQIFQISMLVVLSLTISVSVFNFIDTTSLNVPSYVISMVLTVMALFGLVFGSFDFSYVRAHANLGTAGPATVESVGGGNVIVSLGPVSPTNKAFRTKLSRHLRYSFYLNRWTVYRLGDGESTIELWRDHPIFGNQWYYIKY